MSIIVGEHPVPMTLILVQGSTADLVVPAVPGVLAAPVLEFAQTRAGDAAVTHQLILESGEWVAHLTVAQVAALAGLNNARVKDAGRVVAAGMVQHNSGWDGRAGAHVTVDRLVWGGGAGGGDGADPLAALTTLPASPVAWLPYQFRITAGQAIPSGITWATGAPVIGGWGIVLLIWDGTTWRGEWAEMDPTPPAPADTTPPAWTGTMTTGTPTQTTVPVTASAAPTDNVGVTAREVSINGGSTWATIVPSGNVYTITGLTAGTAYPAPRFRAKDAAGNYSAVLTAQAFTTAAPAGDTTKPVPGTLAASAITPTGFTLTVTGASDAGAGLHATPYRFSTDNGTTWTAWQASNVYTATGKTAATAYQCKHEVRDAAATPNTEPGAVVTVTTASTGALTAAILALTPAGYWKLDEATGTTMSDSSGNAMDGSLTGTEGTDYTRNNGIVFATDAGKVSIPHHASLTPTAAGVTVFCIARRDSNVTSPAPYLVSQNNATARNWAISLSNADVAFGSWNLWGGAAILRSAPFANGAETRLVMRVPAGHNAPTDMFTLAGKSVTAPTGAPDGTFRINSNPIVIGGGAQARVRHVAVFQRELTDTEIQTLLDAAE